MRYALKFWTARPLAETAEQYSGWEMPRPNPNVCPRSTVLFSSSRFCWKLFVKSTRSAGSAGGGRGQAVQWACKSFSATYCNCFGPWSLWKIGVRAGNVGGCKAGRIKSARQNNREQKKMLKIQQKQVKLVDTLHQALNLETWIERNTMMQSFRNKGNS